MIKLKKGIISLYLGIISLYIFISSCHPFSCKEYIKENILYKSVSGVIKAKREKNPCFGTIYFNSDSLEVCICSNQKIWDMLTVNDSLSKKDNTDTFMLYKKNILKTRFKYFCCDR